MITFSPRFRSQSPAQNGGPGGALSYGDMSTLQGLAGNDPRNTLLLNANARYIDDALSGLLSGTPSPINRAWQESNYLNGQDLQDILATRQGIRDGKAQAYFGPDGKMTVRRQGEAGWTSAAPEGAIGIGADGGGYNPLASARVTGLNSDPNARYTHDMIRDPLTGISVNRGQAAAAQQRYGSRSQVRPATGNRVVQVGNMPDLWKGFNSYAAPGSGRGGRMT
jgi:hypothetical protein